MVVMINNLEVQKLMNLIYI